MKFTVLLPTRNRLELLKYAVESVRRQDYSDWEIIISDNLSEQDVAGYIQSLSDPRIKYFRTDNFVPVTDNWNNALNKSSGDYVTMLGDDDCLMKGYFNTIRKLIQQYNNPDFIYHSAFLYSYPKVMPNFPDGFLEPYGYADFLKTAQEPFLLDAIKALKLVKQSLNFRVMFGYNMQFAIMSSKFIASLRNKGNFFQSPYPDYYAMNVMFLTAKRILIFPKPLVTIGISPKSFGFHYFNDSEQNGSDFLKNIPSSALVESLENVLLPGAAYNASWLFALETVKINYGNDYDLHVNYCRYRFLQTMHVIESNGGDKKRTASKLMTLWSRLSIWEKLGYGYLLKIVSSLPQKVRRKVLKRISAAVGTHPHYKSKRINGTFLNILNVYDQIDIFNSQNNYDLRLRDSYSHFCKKSIVKILESLMLDTYYKINSKR